MWEDQYAALRARQFSLSHTAFVFASIDQFSLCTFDRSVVNQGANPVDCRPVEGTENRVAGMRKAERCELSAIFIHPTASHSPQCDHEARRSDCLQAGPGGPRHCRSTKTRTSSSVPHVVAAACSLPGRCHRPLMCVPRSMEGQGPDLVPPTGISDPLRDPHLGATR